MTNFTISPKKCKIIYKNIESKSGKKFIDIENGKKIDKCLGYEDSMTDEPLYECRNCENFLYWSDNNE